MPLGDFFPEEDRLASVRRQLAPGIVLYLHCKFTTPPKDKYLLFTGITNPHYHFFVINTEINDFIKFRAHLSASQVEMCLSDHSFLDHDSYVNCVEFKQMTVDNVENQLLRDMSRIKRGISDPLRDNIIKVVAASKTLSKKDRAAIVRLFGFS